MPPLIRSALSDTGVALIDAPDLPQAVALATQRAHAGDAVLMSPACASLDMFKDYEHRAHSVLRHRCAAWRKTQAKPWRASDVRIRRHSP